jgi:hypothetical protein
MSSDPDPDANADTDSDASADTAPDASADTAPDPDADIDPDPDPDANSTPHPAPDRPRARAFDLSAGDYLRYALVALLVATLLGVGVAASTSTTDFSLYNADWDGASDLRTLADASPGSVELARSTERYAALSPNGSVAIVLSPDEPYSNTDRGRIRAFVRGGGTLVVAEDYGPGGDRLLRAVGASARFDGRPLRDDRTGTSSPAFPVAANVTDHPLTAGVDRLVLNHGTALSPNGATVLVRSSGYAFLDTDRDGTLDEREQLRSHPVATVEPVGDGRVVAVSDPSLFLNAMLDRGGNRRFAANLLAADTVLLDYSHAGALPPLVALRLTLQDSALLQALVGALGVGLLVAWGHRTREDEGDRTDQRVLARLRDAARSADRPGADASGATQPGAVPSGGDRLAADPLRALDAETLRTELAARHPNWDDGRIERVTEGVINQREKWRHDD